MALPKFKWIRTELFGVGDATPVTTQTAVTAPTGGATQDAEARAAIGDILDVLVTFGLVAGDGESS